MPFKALAEQLRMEHLREQKNERHTSQLPQQPQDPLVDLLTQIAGALGTPAATRLPPCAGSRFQSPFSTQQYVLHRQTLAAAAARNQQLAHDALNQQQLLDWHQKQHQSGPASSRSMTESHASIPPQQQQQRTYQQISTGAPCQSSSLPVGTSPSALHTVQQQQTRQCEGQLSQDPTQTGAQGRRRGRPAASTKVHPNLVYVRRHRERQKQTEHVLQVTLEARKKQLEELQAEQKQLCDKWEALEQILHVQNTVMSLMKQLKLAEPAAREVEPDPTLSCKQLQQLLIADGVTVTAQPPAPMPSSCNATASNTSGTDLLCSTSSSSSRSSGQFSIDAAVAEAAAVLQEPSPAFDPVQEQAALMQQARQWMEPIKLYCMGAAMMLHQLRALPATPAAAAALAAANSCPTVAVTTTPQATEAVVAAAVSAAAAEASESAAAKAAVAVAVAIRAAWDKSAGENGMPAAVETVVEGVPLVRYPYGYGMYVITPEQIKNICWTLNMLTWQVDDSNSQAHAESAARALWAALRPERWRLLKATWDTMSHQIKAVQHEFGRLHNVLRTIVHKPASKKPSVSVNTTSGSSSEEDGSALVHQLQPQQQKAHGPCMDGFDSFEDSTAFEYAAAAVQVESVLMREDAISFQVCGAMLDLLDPLEVAVGFVSSWPYHPQVLVMFDTIFKMGEPPAHASALPIMRQVD